MGICEETRDQPGGREYADLGTHWYTRLLIGWSVRTAQRREYTIFTNVSGIMVKLSAVFYQLERCSRQTCGREEQRKEREHPRDRRERERPEVRVVLCGEQAASRAIVSLHEVTIEVGIPTLKGQEQAE